MKVARSRRAKVLFNEASDYEGEKHSARGKPEYSGRKIPDDCSQPILRHQYSLIRGDTQFSQEIHHGRIATSKNKKRGSRSCRVVPQLRSA